MTHNDPHPANADEGIYDLAKYRSGDLIVDHKAKKCAGEHSDDAGSDHREIRHIETTEEETDKKNYEIVDTEECLDGCQVFLFTFCGRQQIESRGGSAGGEEAVADAADDAQNSS